MVRVFHRLDPDGVLGYVLREFLLALRKEILTPQMPWRTSVRHPVLIHHLLRDLRLQRWPNRACVP